MKPALLFIISLLLFIILYNAYTTSKIKEGFLSKLIGPHLRPHMRDLDSRKEKFKNNIYNKLITYKRKIGL